LRKTLLNRVTSILFVFLFALIANHLHAQDSLATVYFYRQAKFGGSFVSYQVKHEDMSIGKMTSGSAFKYSSQAGLQTFSAKTEAESFVKIDIKPGQTYFVECGISSGVLAGHPSFRQVSGAEAKREMAKIDLRLSRQIPDEALSQQGPREDSVRALSNLFQRKRKNGVIRAVIFGAVALGTAIGIITYKPTTVDFNGQTVELDSSPPPADYVLLGVSGALMITGIVQHNKYNVSKLDRILEDRKQGRGIPQEIKSKLKKKDFK
jgi:hypothetical protein